MRRWSRAGEPLSTPCRAKYRALPPAYRFLDLLAYERWWTDRSSHHWAMRHGERQIREYLDVA